MEKKKFKLNIIDILIIVAVLLVGAFLVMKLTGTGSDLTAPNLKTAYITFYKEEVADYVIEKTQIGDSVLDNEEDLIMGKVSKIYTEEPVSYMVDNETEKMVEGSRTGYSSLYLTVECQATESEFGAVIDGQLYSVGHTMVLRAGYGKYYLTVYDVQFAE